MTNPKGIARHSEVELTANIVYLKWTGGSDWIDGNPGEPVLFRIARSPPATKDSETVARALSGYGFDFFTEEKLNALPEGFWFNITYNKTTGRGQKLTCGYKTE